MISSKSKCCEEHMIQMIPVEVEQVQNDRRQQGQQHQSEQVEEPAEAAESEEFEETAGAAAAASKEIEESGGAAAAAGVVEWTDSGAEFQVEPEFEMDAACDSGSLGGRNACESNSFDNQCSRMETTLTQLVEATSGP